MIVFNKPHWTTGTLPPGQTVPRKKPIPGRVYHQHFQHSSKAFDISKSFHAWWCQIASARQKNKHNMVEVSFLLEWETQRNLCQARYWQSKVLMERQEKSKITAEKNVHGDFFCVLLLILHYNNDEGHNSPWMDYLSYREGMALYTTVIVFLLMIV